jgi:putative redox protein
MKATIQYQGGMHFSGKTQTGHDLHFDSRPKGEPSAGASPMEMVLQAGAVCCAMDVVAILNKRRKAIERFEIEVNGERSEEHPKVFKSVDVLFRLWGRDLTQEEVDKATQLSNEKYCSVLNMLKPSVKVTCGVEVNPA